MGSILYKILHNVLIQKLVPILIKKVLELLSDRLPKAQLT